MLIHLVLFILTYCIIGIAVGFLYLIAVKYNLIEWQDYSARQTIFMFSPLAWPILIIAGIMALIFTGIEKMFEFVDDRIFPS